MDAILYHGDFSQPYQLDTPKLKLKMDDLDQLQWKWAAPTADAFEKGGSAPAPYQHFKIQDMEVEKEDDEYLFSLACEGLHQLKARRVKGGYEETGKIGEWDTYRDRWLTGAKGRFRKGLRVGNYVCLSVTETEKLTGVSAWETTGEFAGLKQRMAPRRVVTSNGQIISSDQLRVNLVGGWVTARKGQASLPKIVITDTQHDFLPPPTSAVPGTRTPPNAPGVRIITFTGGDVRALWPWGWVFTCGYEQPFGLDVPLYINTYNYELNQRYLPA